PPSASKSTITGKANKPSANTGSGIPFDKYNKSKEYRYSVTEGAAPILPKISPNKPAAIPVIGLLPDNTPTILSPKNASINNSGEPKLKINGFTIGIAKNNANPPNTPPIIDDINPAPS